MDNPAQLEHVTGSFERPLTVGEEKAVPEWLDTAWRKLQRRVAGIPARCELADDTPGHLAVEDVRDVVVAMVERKLRNPDGMRSWNGDTEGGTVDSTLSSGQLYVTDDEVRDLAPRDPDGSAGGAFSMQLGRP